MNYSLLITTFLCVYYVSFEDDICEKGKGILVPRTFVDFSKCGHIYNIYPPYTTIHSCTGWQLRNSSSFVLSNSVRLYVVYFWYLPLRFISSCRHILIFFYILYHFSSKIHSHFFVPINLSILHRKLLLLLQFFLDFVIITLGRSLRLFLFFILRNFS